MSKRVFILSGAGLSAESGIRTFRDSDGLWEEYSVEEVCSIGGWERDRDKVTKFYDARRADLKDKKPNRAHKMIAYLKNKFPDNIEVLTQNVDDLLERAGCEDVIHLHGTLTDLRCEDCGNIFKIGYDSQDRSICPRCESDRIRHNVVMFGEAAPEYVHLHRLYNEADMVVVIGTSGYVIDIAYIAQLTDYSILNNLDSDPNIDQYFSKVYTLRATEAIDMIVDDVEEFLE